MCHFMQSSPKINSMLIRRLSYLQRRSSRFLSPVSTVSVMERVAYNLGKTDEKKRLHFQSLAVLKQARLTNNSMICSDIWHTYHSRYFKIVSNFTRLTACEITYNNFEISLVAFMPNITTNHAITYTYGLKSSLRNMEM